MFSRRCTLNARVASSVPVACMRIRRRPEVEITNFHGALTASDSMREFFQLVERVSKTDSSVLIRGETGTGKELIARAIHNLSPRAPGPFQAVNCATLTPELLASELFGHVKGAFTGAISDRRGLFSLADKGTIFLDEIAELPLDIQARLLRVLQERTFVPLGGTEPLKVNVRVLSATHQALRELVEAGRFREDLMYRIRVVPLYLPRLADRVGDIEALTWHFIHDFNKYGGRLVTGIADEALQAMLHYSWPGNVRELRNVIENAFAVGDGDVLTVDELTPELRGERPRSAHNDDKAELEESLDERHRIMKALAASGGRRDQAAEMLGYSRSTLWRKMRELKLR